MRTNEVAGKIENVILWALQIAAALLFLMAGGLKMIGARPAVELFERIGIGQWFRYVTGALEIAGAIALLIPRVTGWGALLMAVVMAGAVCAQVVLGDSPVIPAVLLVVTGGVAWARLRRTARAVSRSQSA